MANGALEFVDFLALCLISSMLCKVFNRFPITPFADLIALGKCKSDLKLQVGARSWSSMFEAADVLFMRFGYNDTVEAIAT